MRIDLHAHTTASDGTETPSELPVRAKEAGLDVVAITDHDTTAGWDEAAAAADREGIGLVRGMEMSASCRGISSHILGYLFDPKHPAIVSHNSTVRDSRSTRLRTMADKLAADGLLTWDDVVEHTPAGATPGRPHLADTLVGLGVTASRDEAFATILSARGPYYVRYQSPDVTDAIATIAAAGGISVWAHPMARTRGGVVTWDDIGDAIDAGLDGLEIDHRDNASDDRDELRKIAQSRGILVTGSSDYHGSGKPNLLGENLTSPAVLERIAHKASLEVLRP